MKFICSPGLSGAGPTYARRVDPSQSAIVRPRLLEPLQGRFGRRLTLVCAGAGFGKTTLLRQAVHEARLARLGADVLLTCAPDHAVASQLAGDLLVAITGVSPREPVLDPETAAHLVREAVWARAPDQVCLVLDDLHLLPTDSPGHDLIARLLSRLPGNGHLLLASRRRPRLPVARLVSQGDALVLDASQLAFSAEENVAVARLRGTSPQTIAAAGGWPALAALITASGGNHVGDFLAEEILAPMPADDREVLALLCRLDGGDDALLSEVLGRPVRLTPLLTGLPLVTDDGRGWWRLHDLWREVLPPQGPDPQTVAASAAALRHRGHRREAMNLLLTSADTPQTWEEIARLVVGSCSAITPLVPEDVLRSWYDRLPATRVASPQAALLLGMALKPTDPDLAEKHLADAAEAFRVAADLHGELAALLGRFHVAFARSDRPRMLEVSRRWSELAAAGVGRAAAEHHVGRALLASDLGQVAQEVAALDALPTELANSTIAWLRAHLHLLSLGDPQLALAWCDRALAGAPATLVTAIRCEQVEAFRHLGRIDEARAEARRLSPDADTPRHLLALLALQVVTGDIAAASVLLRRLRARAGTSPLGWAPLAPAIGAALLAIAEGDEGSAATSVAALRDHPMARPTGLLRVNPAALPVQYVLDPKMRPTWEDIDLRGVHAQVRRLARTLVGLRDGATVSAPGVATLTNDDLDLARVVLPIPWSTLLCAHAGAAGREHAVDVAKAIGPPARPTLHALDDAGGPPGRIAHRLLAAIPPRPRHRVAVRVLGPLSITRDGVDVENPHLARERVRQLIGLLVVRRAVSRQAVSAAIWPDLPEADAARNLRVTLNYVQQVLEPERDERDSPFFLRAQGTILRLADDPALEVDLWSFHADLDEADAAERRGAPSLALAAMERAVARRRGDLLADLPPADWLMQERELAQRRFVRAAVRLADLLAADGDLERPEALALAALEAEPWSEPAYQVLVATLLDRGDIAAARRALDRCFDMLDDLGVQASPRSVALAERIRRGGRAPAAR